MFDVKFGRLLLDCFLPTARGKHSKRSFSEALGSHREKMGHVWLEKDLLLCWSFLARGEKRRSSRFPRNCKKRNGRATQAHLYSLFNGFLHEMNNKFRKNRSSTRAHLEATPKRKLALAFGPVPVRAQTCARAPGPTLAPAIACAPAHASAHILVHTLAAICAGTVVASSCRCLVCSTTGWSRGQPC